MTDRKTAKYPRWTKTGIGVWGLEYGPRRFAAFVSLISGGMFSWYLTGVPSYSMSCTWESGVKFVNCGEESTESAAKKQASDSWAALKTSLSFNQ